MPRYKLTYLDMPTSRGEECRLALHLAGVPFEDERLQRGAWPERKPTTPFGAIPVLAVEGAGELGQTNAILRYLGSAHGLHPSDAWEAARHEAVMCAVEELRARIDPSMRTDDADAKKRMREELATGYLQQWGTSIERQIGDGPFMGGAQVNVADLKLFVVVTWLRKGVLDHMPPDVLVGYPKLNRLVDAVREHPGVVAWYAKR
ncbi:MAG: glutathione S-transferase family protein [Deltaproteobacteria bacterium]|nr:glutathione S-transferase family protein [Nannocystaceae bacterium]